MQTTRCVVAQSLAHASILDALRPFSKHRQYNRPIATALMAESATLDLGRRIGQCSQRLALEIELGPQGPQHTLLRGAKLCNARLCPFCEWRRTRVWRRRILNGLELYSIDQPKRSGVFLTLTTRNVPLSQLKESIAHLHKSFERLTKTSLFPTDAWFRRTEVTVRSKVPNQPLSVHPHLHCLLLVKPSYWGREYIKQTQWQQAWQMAARLDYAPVVDVRRAKATKSSDSTEGLTPISAVLEAAKYATKATDLLSLGNQLPEFNQQMRGIRLYGFSKILTQYIKSADPKTTDLLDPAEPELTRTGEWLSAVATWHQQTQEYAFTS